MPVLKVETINLNTTPRTEETTVSDSEGSILDIYQYFEEETGKPFLLSNHWDNRILDPYDALELLRVTY
jgi:hypothetical protein